MIQLAVIKYLSARIRKVPCLALRVDIAHHLFLVQKRLYGRIHRMEHTAVVIPQIDNPCLRVGLVEPCCFFIHQSYVFFPIFLVEVSYWRNRNIGVLACYQAVFCFRKIVALGILRYHFGNRKIRMAVFQAVKCLHKRRISLA
ncbi:hypothetical protein D3C86_1549470 [compost metagenome]